MPAETPIRGTFLHATEWIVTRRTSDSRRGQRSCSPLNISNDSDLGNHTGGVEGLLGEVYDGGQYGRLLTGPRVRLAVTAGTESFTPPFWEIAMQGPMSGMDRQLRDTPRVSLVMAVELNRGKRNACIFFGVITLGRMALPLAP